MPSRNGFVAATVAAGVGAALAVAAVVTAFDAQAAPRSVAVDAASLRHDGADALALEQGRVYYVQLCMDCHGARGDGRGAWAYRVTPRPSNLTAVRTQARSDAELFRIVSEPRPGTPMLGWSRQLSESQRHQLVAYLRRLGQPS
ncbi:MAG TPA: cytochrome c [Burkholderiaceae bacterium]